jgi:hypothetical protein
VVSLKEFSFISRKKLVKGHRAKAYEFTQTASSSGVQSKGPAAGQELEIRQPGVYSTTK